MKITVIGAGSTYTPELVAGLIEESKNLGLHTLYLYDIDLKRLGILTGFAKQMVASAGDPFEVHSSLNRREALSEASFVINQIRVGGQRARHLDTTFCLSHGVIGQETVGPAGFAKALRTIPVVLDICKEMERAAPLAWLINFTNPAGIITEAVSKYGGVKVIGLCNCPAVMRKEIGEGLESQPHQTQCNYIGLNHFGWITSIRVGNRDVISELLKKKESTAEKTPAYPKGFLTSLNMLPNPYLKYYYLKEEMLAYLLKREKSRAEEVMELEEKLLLTYQDPTVTQKPEELGKRGGALYSAVAISLMVSLLLGDGREHIINVPNQGALSHLSNDSVVEIPVTINKEGMKRPQFELPLEIRGLLLQMKAYEELTIEAAVKRDKRKALIALANNPLVLSAPKASLLLERLDGIHQLSLF